MRLRKKSIVKPWGKTDLPQVFGGTRKRKIGEIWFEPPEGITPELMIKYLFTSEKLSIQVHPDDRLARRAGYPQGKDECWYVLEAEPDAVLGIGLTKDVSPTKLRAAVVCGEMEQLMDWKPVKAGDFYFVPAGTIHAIGPGITLVELQQNADVTFRLYDYERPRQLHLEEAIAVAKPTAYDLKHHRFIAANEAIQIFNGPPFKLFQAIGSDMEILAGTAASEWQVIPLEGEAKVRGKTISAGECGLCAKSEDIDLSQNIRCLIACNMK